MITSSRMLHNQADGKQKLVNTLLTILAQEFKGHDAGQV